MAEGEIDLASLIGICSVIDKESTILSQIIDYVAALSCEATKANITSFNGSSYEEAINVAKDLNFLLSGSKVVGKFEIEEISKIPMTNGKFRDVVKKLHSDTQRTLNSSVKGNSEYLWLTLSALLRPIKSLGECSFLRAKRCFELTCNENLLKDLCVEYDNLKNGFKLAFFEEENYVKFAHELNKCLRIVWSIVGLEAVAAFSVLDADKEVAAFFALDDVDQGESKKKTASLLGKGTTMIIRFIYDRLKSSKEPLQQMFNLDSPDFGYLLDQVKEIVQSNDYIPKLPKGTRDFAKKQMIIREKAFSSIRKVFKRHGATALDTPVFELRETLMGKYGEDSKLIYDLANQGGELLSLRYDLTVPFARYMAMNTNITSFKRYQIGKVYRRDNTSKGRYREFYQCDFDIAGVYGKMGPDSEVIKILTELLDELKIEDYEVKVNHRKLLDGMLEICGVPKEKVRTICSSIDKLDKMSFEDVKREMVEEKGLSFEIADRIGRFVKEKGLPMEILSKLREQGSEFLANESTIEALDELSILFELLEISNCIEKIVFDLSLARGLDYYTGVIFEVVCKQEAEKVEVGGSIAAGGRYDNLIGRFGNRQVPAVGMSLGIERVFNILEKQMVVRPTETQVLVSMMVKSEVMDEGKQLAEAVELVSKLWEAKINAEYLVSKRREKHFTYVKDSEIPWMVMVGAREISQGQVTLCLMDDKAKVVEKVENVPRDCFVEELLKRL